MTETQASRVLREATDDLAPDVDELVRGGVARGGALRRRRRVGTSLAAAAVVGVLGVVASVGPTLLDDGPGATDPGAAADRTTEPTPAPPELTVTASGPIVVAAADVPATVSDLLGDGVRTRVREGGSFPLVDEARHKIVHFEYAGTLATFTIEPIGSLASCADMVDPVNQADGKPGGVCRDVGDTVQLAFDETADGARARGVMVWRGDWIVSALSYDSVDGRAPAVADEPPISADELVMLATSDVWFG